MLLCLTTQALDDPPAEVAFNPRVWPCYLPACNLSDWKIGSQYHGFKWQGESFTTFFERLLPYQYDSNPFRPNKFREIEKFRSSGSEQARSMPFSIWEITNLCLRVPTGFLGPPPLFPKHKFREICCIKTPSSKSLFAIRLVRNWLWTKTS